MYRVRGKVKQKKLLVGKYTATPAQAWAGPERSRRFGLPDIMTNGT
jgi:hypothetical protein